MMSKRAILCAISLLIAASGPLWAAEAAKKPAAKPRGKSETLACRLGTEDRHARIAVVVIGGKTDSFAYYSKWKPRTCSVYLQRNRDMYSKWADSGNITTVNLEKGAFLIEHKPGEYHFIFRDIDRERYCGMDGVINGSLTIKRGSDQCVLDGELMVEGTPLGQAHIAREEDKPPPGMMPDLEPEATTAAPAKPAAPAAAGKPPAPAAEPGKPAAAAAAPVKPAAASPATAAPPAAPAAVAPAAPAAASAAPPTASIDKPAASAPAEGATRVQAETAPVSGAAPAKAPAAGQPAASDAPRGAEKPADAPSGNPFSGFFRSMRPGTPPAAP